MWIRARFDRGLRLDERGAPRGGIMEFPSAASSAALFGFFSFSVRKMRTRPARKGRPVRMPCSMRADLLCVAPYPSDRASFLSGWSGFSFPIAARAQILTSTDYQVLGPGRGSRSSRTSASSSLARHHLRIHSPASRPRPLSISSRASPPIPSSRARCGDRRECERGPLVDGGRGRARVFGVRLFDRAVECGSPYLYRGRQCLVLFSDEYYDGQTSLSPAPLIKPASA